MSKRGGEEKIGNEGGTIGGGRRVTVGVERRKYVDTRPIFCVPKEVSRCLFLLVLFRLFRVGSMVLIPFLLFEIKLLLSDGSNTFLVV